MKIYCTGCEKEVEARLTDGSEIYPYRADLYDLPFWKCDTCASYVGCHYKTEDRTRPLGYLASKKYRDLKIQIHALLDPLWKSGRLSRKEIYNKISKKLGRQYHTGEIKSVKEANKIIKFISHLKEQKV